MKITLNIKGMMCPHCERAVKKTLEEFAGVENADVSHEKGTAVVKTNGDVNFDELKKAVAGRGYEVTGVEETA